MNSKEIHSDEKPVTMMTNPLTALKIFNNYVDKPTSPTRVTNYKATAKNEKIDGSNGTPFSRAKKFVAARENSFTRQRPGNAEAENSASSYNNFVRVPSKKSQGSPQPYRLTDENGGSPRDLSLNQKSILDNSNGAISKERFNSGRRILNIRKTHKSSSNGKKGNENSEEELKYFRQNKDRFKKYFYPIGASKPVSSLKRSDNSHTNYSKMEDDEDDSKIMKEIEKLINRIKKNSGESTGGGSPSTKQEKLFEEKAKKNNKLESEAAFRKTDNNFTLRKDEVPKALRENMSPASPRNEIVRKFDKRVNITEFSRTSPPNVGFLDLSPTGTHGKKEVESKNKHFLENEMKGNESGERGLRKIEVKKSSRVIQAGNISPKEDTNKSGKTATTENNGNLFRITSGHGKTTAHGSSPRIISFDDLITNKQHNLEADYEGIENLGQGSYATVKFARNRETKKAFAIKIYDKGKLVDQQKARNVRREISILSNLSHANIIKLYKVIETTDSINLVLEYVGRSSLYSYLKAKPGRKLREEEGRKIFRQVVEGIKYCHAKSVVHRDIKLENLLLDDKKMVKIIDFGFSVCIPNTKKLSNFCGTPTYMAPEIVSKKDYHGAPVDIWALGVLLFVLLTGLFPFKAADEKELYKKILKGSFEFPPHLTEPAKGLISKMLNMNAAERINITEVSRDPWLIGENALISKQPSSNIIATVL